MRQRRTRRLVWVGLMAALNFASACGGNKESSASRWEAGQTIYTARGTYDFDGLQLTINFTSSDFPCRGPGVGTIVYSADYLDDQMIILNQGVDTEMVLLQLPPDGTLTLDGRWEAKLCCAGYEILFDNGTVTFNGAGILCACSRLSSYYHVLGSYTPIPAVPCSTVENYGTSSAGVPPDPRSFYIGSTNLTATFYNPDPDPANPISYFLILTCPCNEAWIDAVEGSDGLFYPAAVSDNVLHPENVAGPPDGNAARVGDVNAGMCGGYIVIDASTAGAPLEYIIVHVP